MSEWKVHLEFEEDNSSKFWRARVEGKTLFVNYGRIGTAGQTQMKELASAEAALKELDKLEREKRKKGYQDAGGGSGDGEDEDEGDDQDEDEDEDEDEDDAPKAKSAGKSAPAKPAAITARLVLTAQGRSSCSKAPRCASAPRRRTTPSTRPRKRSTASRQRSSPTAIRRSKPRPSAWSRSPPRVCGAARIVIASAGR
jgi:predicted DNA-binding WGR domain protein